MGCFWKAIGNFRKKRRRKRNGIGKERWVNHFKNLLGEINNEKLDSNEKTEREKRERKLPEKAVGGEGKGERIEREIEEEDILK